MKKIWKCFLVGGGLMLSLQSNAVESAQNKTSATKVTQGSQTSVGEHIVNGRKQELFIGTGPVYSDTSKVDQSPLYRSKDASGLSRTADDEYQKSWGLDAINAAAVQTIGGTGVGQAIAIVDTGVDGSHPELSGNLLAASYDFIANTSTMTDPGNHGTHVAGIAAGAKNGAGAHGVAYDAEILGIRLLGEAYKSFDEIAGMYQYAVDNDAKILNNSWGATGISVDGMTTENTQALFGNNIAQVGQNLVEDDDAVFVWSAGNDEGQEVNIMAGLPYHFPELQDGWVAVVAVNPTGGIASYSNHCGESAEWCLAAPGTSIYSAAAGGGYMSSSGASMATPHVSGALAALKSAFPTLTNQQILESVLRTADKTGIYADSAIYGNGMLDMEAAKIDLAAIVAGIPDDNPVSGDDAAWLIPILSLLLK